MSSDGKKITRHHHREQEKKKHRHHSHRSQSSSVNYGVRRRWYFGIEETELRNEIVKRLGHRCARHDEFANRKMRETKGRACRQFSDATIDAVALVKEDISLVARAVRCQQVRNPRQLLVGDQHEARTSIQELFDFVFAAPQPDELGIQFRHAVFDLLIPRRERILWGNDQKALACAHSIEKLLPPPADRKPNLQDL